jgi:SAM-dependent methyltransferase
MKSNNCPDLHEFSSSTFNYSDNLYFKQVCSNCGLVITEPCNGLSGDIYDSGHYTLKKFFLVPLLINLLDYFYIILLLKFKGLRNKHNILDFGCGKGFFLYTLKLCGFNNLFGLETSKGRADFARSLSGVNISEDYYISGKILDRKFNQISFIHVLEHIPEPFLFLDSIIYGAVEDKGIIFIEVPNMGSFSSKIAKNYWAHFTPHFHTNHFTVSSLREYCLNRNRSFTFVGTFSFYNSAMGMTSALLSIFGYKGSIFEDLKCKKVLIIISFVLLLPFSLFLEFIFSVFFKKGSVIKFIIYK